METSFEREVNELPDNGKEDGWKSGGSKRELKGWMCFQDWFRAVIGLPLTAINPRTMKVEWIPALADVLRSSTPRHYSLRLQTSLALELAIVFEFLASTNGKIVGIFLRQITFSNLKNSRIIITKYRLNEYNYTGVKQ